MSEKKSIPAKIALIVAGVISAVVLVVVLLLVILSVFEFRPKPVTQIKTEGKSEHTLSLGESFKIVSMNIGYGALGDNADFLLDGGKHLLTADKERVLQNMTSIISGLKEIEPDILLLQEVDLSATRSFYVNEFEMVRREFPEMEDSYALNFKLIPIHPLRKIQSGISTFSSYPVSSSERIQLPCIASWPVTTIKMKRCLLVSRIPVQGIEREFVLVNLHLEAYDSGEGKIAQTKQLREFLQAEFDKGNYVIAGGDFNQNFGAMDFSRYPVYEGTWQPGKLEEDEFGSDWQFLVDAETPTCRSLDKPYAGADKENFQYYLIDGFVVSRNIAVSSVKTVSKDFASSDHNPVVIEVTLN